MYIVVLGPGWNRIEARKPFWGFLCVSPRCGRKIVTLPKLLFVLEQKGVTLHEGKRKRIRFNPRGPVSQPLKAAIQEHRDALLELLRGGDVDDWRRVRLRPRDDDPLEPIDDGTNLEDDPFDEDRHLAIAEQCWMEDRE